MADHDVYKLPDVDSKAPDDEMKRSASMTSDSNGNTVVTRETGETYLIEEKAERALVWKFDLHILPLLAIMYLFNALDKSNLGNAKTAGLEEDLVRFPGIQKCVIERC